MLFLAGQPPERLIPTFGTTVVISGGLRGEIYNIPPKTRHLPKFENLQPIGAIYTYSLNVPVRDFREGFPGVTDRFEWFAIDYRGKFWIAKPGKYEFSLLSDDGAMLYIDDRTVVSNDGLHPPRKRHGVVTLTRGMHNMRVSYFQGPAMQVALILSVKREKEAWRIFSMNDFSPPTDPELWK